jgi:pimeloyl-ACP methyl ester carboxylesterase
MQKILTQHDLPSTAVESHKHPVLFVPGYMGSELYRNGEQIWLTGMQALGLATPDLSLNSPGLVEAKYPFTELRFLFGLFKYEVYADWMAFLREQKAWVPYVFAYDWRLSNNTHADALLDFLENISLRHAGGKVHVVGHSNGGVLALSVMNRKPELFASATLAGAPIRGGISFMEDLMPGLSTGLNAKITAPGVVGTFELPYSFFPRNYGTDPSGALTTSSGEILSVDFYKAQDWEKYRLGIFGKSTAIKQPPDKLHFQKILDAAKRFKDSLDWVKANSYPPILVVYTQCCPTLAGLSGRPTGDGWAWDFKNRINAPGDGRVMATSALPDPAFRVQTLVSQSAHSAIINEKAVQKHVQKFIDG